MSSQLREVAIPVKTLDQLIWAADQYLKENEAKRQPCKGDLTFLSNAIANAVYHIRHDLVVECSHCGESFRKSEKVDGCPACSSALVV
jgi:rubrerythrin